MMFLEGIRAEEQPVLEANGPGVRDALDHEVPGVLERGEPRRIGPRRWRIAGRGRRAAEGRVRPLLVVLVPKRAKEALLAGEIGGGRTRGLRLEPKMSKGDVIALCMGTQRP
jgi:hypothetical protein